METPIVTAIRKAVESQYGIATWERVLEITQHRCGCFFADDSASADTVATLIQSLDEAPSLNAGTVMALVDKYWADQSGTLPLKTSGANRSSSSLTILAAEDNATNQILIKRIFQREGHSITIVENGIHAVAAHGEGPFDLVLMDLQMPHMGGLDAAVAIRTRELVAGGHTPILAVTANDTAECRDQCTRAGMDGFIAKPFRPRELLQMINRYRPATPQAESRPADTPVVTRTWDTWKNTPGS